jgi:hypothetical protein
MSCRPVAESTPLKLNMREDCAVFLILPSACIDDTLAGHLAFADWDSAGGRWRMGYYTSVFGGYLLGLRLRDDGVSGVLSAGTFQSTLLLSLVPCWQRVCMSTL